MKIASATGRSESSEGHETDPPEVVESGSCHDGVAPAASVPLRAVLERVGQELAQLAERLDRFETEVGPRILEAAGRDADLVHHLQSLDEIGQRVTGLVVFLGALAPSAASRCRLDPRPAAGVVTLADMAARLGFRDEDEPAVHVDGGDCELL
jgi:hypothetical protein